MIAQLQRFEETETGRRAKDAAALAARSAKETLIRSEAVVKDVVGRTYNAVRTSGVVSMATPVAEKGRDLFARSMEFVKLKKKAPTPTSSQNNSTGDLLGISPGSSSSPSPVPTSTSVVTTVGSLPPGATSPTLPSSS